MDTSPEGVCGLCGQLMNADRTHQHGDREAVEQGRCVKYVVIELRGAIAHFQDVDDSTQTDKTVAAGLAEQLGIDLAELLGCRFTCWEEPGEYGVIQSDFRLA
ncbi:hypothetical protein [Streptomyces sp. NPDC093089]|uniref:hypothetical protein n=1 Tax=Streptomyces sp. NPDC093089 TaxID=3366024 RepID=UPI00381FFE6F